MIDSLVDNNILYNIFFIKINKLSLDGCTFQAQFVLFEQHKIYVYYYNIKYRYESNVLNYYEWGKKKIWSLLKLINLSGEQFSFKLNLEQRLRALKTLITWI